MISASHLKPGSVILHGGQIFQVEATSRGGTGQQKATFHAKLRNLETGERLERAFHGDQSFEEPAVERREAQYSYRKGREFVFIDQVDFNEHTLTENQLGNAVRFLREGEMVQLLVVDGRALSLQLPGAVALEIVETAPPVHGQVDSVLKEAKLETGLVIKVPQFMKQGEKVRVSTETLEYLGRA